MKKIIHMSDLHVGFKDLGQRFLDITEHIKEQMGSKAGDYCIVITGDLIENAYEPEEYTQVQEGLASLRQAGFKDILLIPGNHDYGTGCKGDKKFVPIFQETFFKEISGYPRKNIIEDVAFIGLDSIAEELHWYDALWSEGELGKEQLDRLSAILEQEDVRSCQKRVIYLHHHPFDARPLHQLKDSKNLKKVLEAALAQDVSIDALLYGHNHEGKSHNGEWGIARCYDAGSATGKPRPKFVEGMEMFQVNSSIRIIDLEQENSDNDHVLTIPE